ncbi:hypothetical protein [Burkholderia cenocepacia]|uniref:hypothetical protein n=1 Tax=Burkholderia cenocepacia TaxID=95486 RepID=UPI00187EE1FE|nr:hypothetical protein [Burkholderia cenocepacia]
MKAKIKHWWSVLAKACVYAALLVAWLHYHLDGARLVLMACMWILIVCAVPAVFVGAPEVKVIPSRAAYWLAGARDLAVSVIVIWCGYPVTGTLFLVAVCFVRAVVRVAVGAKTGV